MGQLYILLGHGSEIEFRALRYPRQYEDHSPCDMFSVWRTVSDQGQRGAVPKPALNAYLTTKPRAKLTAGKIKKKKKKTPPPPPRRKNVSAGLAGAFDCGGSFTLGLRTWIFRTGAGTLLAGAIGQMRGCWVGAFTSPCLEERDCAHPHRARLKAVVDDGRPNGRPPDQTSACLLLASPSLCYPYLEALGLVSAASSEWTQVGAGGFAAELIRTGFGTRAGREVNT